MWVLFRHTSVVGLPFARISVHRGGAVYKQRAGFGAVWRHGSLVSVEHWWDFWTETESEETQPEPETEVTEAQPEPETEVTETQPETETEIIEVQTEPETELETIEE